MKAMRPPGCNGGVSSFFLSKLPRPPLFFCTQSTFLLFFDATQVCYCNHFHYCNDRHKVSLPPSDEKEKKGHLHLFYHQVTFDDHHCDQYLPDHYKAIDTRCQKNTDRARK